MKNTLTIHWKDYLGKRLTPCPRPQQETFYNVSDPWAVLNRRVKENIAYAVYNGQFLIQGEKKIQPKPVIAVAEVLPVKKQSFFDKAASGFKSIFKSKMFSRQKH